MICLVSTPNFILHVDIRSRDVTVLECYRPEYYGMSWLSGSSSLVTSHSGLDNETLRDLDTYAMSEKGWISHGMGKTYPFLSAPHQILCCSDGRIVCTNTGRNRLVAIDPSTPGHFHEVGISERRWDRLSLEGPLGDHLNSIFEHEGKLYAIAHGHNAGSSLAVFSYPELVLLSVTPVVARTGLHNVFVSNPDQILSCHSEAGAVIDIASGTLLWEAGTPIYTRGLAATDDLILIGESMKTGRDLRRSSMSGLWIIDRRTWRAIDYMALGPFGVVNEVRIIDEPDLAHHGTPLAEPGKLLLETALQVTRRTRLNAAESVVAARQLWKGFNFVFGCPETTSVGRKYANEALCLAIRRPLENTDTWELDYEITPNGHISIVFDYHGKGGDTDMTAFLLQIATDGVTLTRWEEAGNGWVMLEQIRTHALPPKGRIAVKQSANMVVLAIGGQQIYSGNATSSRGAIGSSGIRWLNAAIIPVNDSAAANERLS